MDEQKEKQLRAMERLFWEVETDYYARHLAANACMVFPDPNGQLNREEALRSISGAARWLDLDIQQSTQVELHSDMILLCYHASAKRETDAEQNRV